MYLSCVFPHLLMFLKEGEACMYTLQHLTCSGSGFLALSLRDAEWRQWHRHLVLCHSSLLPLTVCGRLISEANLCLCYRLCGCAKGACEVEVSVSLCVKAIFLYMLCMCVCWKYLHSVSTCVCVCVCVCVLMWWCSDVQCECGSLLCLSLHLWLWQPARPTRSCCHMLAASVRAEQKP